MQYVNLFKNATHFFYRKKVSIEEETRLKSRVNETLVKFLEEEVLKSLDIEYKLAYTVSKGIIKIETKNKLIAQEIALRIRFLEEKLRKEGIVFKKLMV